jgi:hypothetical protein
MRHLVLALVMSGLAACQGEAPGAQQALSGDPALEELDGASRQAALSSPVPVLLLPEGWRSTVMSGRGFYAVSARDGELAVSIHASDVVHHAGDGMQAPEPREHTVRGRPARVLVNDGIRSVTWDEGRTSYVVEVECYRALEDPRCTEAAFVVALAESLVEVGR